MMEEEMKKAMVVMVVVVCGLMILGCFHRLIASDGPYRGRIVDADTGEPIEGVVVLGTWYTEFPTLAGGVQKYYDAREAVTDERGEFVIAGQGVRMVSNLRPMRPLIFKAGYEYVEFYWHTLKKRQGYRMNVTWDGDMPIIPLRKLSMKERRKSIYSPPLPPTGASYENVKAYLNEWNKDSIERGLQPLTIWGGVKL
jgi:hypothetical protein